MGEIIKLKDLPPRRIAKCVGIRDDLYFCRDAQASHGDTALWIWTNSGSFEERAINKGIESTWDVELLPVNTTVTFLFDGRPYGPLR